MITVEIKVNGDRVGFIKIRNTGQVNSYESGYYFRVIGRRNGLLQDGTLLHKHNDSYATLLEEIFNQRGVVSSIQEDYREYLKYKPYYDERLQIQSKTVTPPQLPKVQE